MQTGYGNHRARQEPFDETCLPVSVGMAVVAKALGQCALQPFVRLRGARIVAKQVAKEQMPAPRKGIDLEEMRVRDAAALAELLEVEAPGDAVFAEAFVPDRAHRLDGLCAVGRRLHSRHEIEDRLSGQAGHRSASDVLDAKDDARAGGQDGIPLLSKELRPFRTVRDDFDEIAFRSEQIPKIHARAFLPRRVAGQES